MRVEFDIKIKGKTEVPERCITEAIKIFVTNLETTKGEIVEALKEDMEDKYSILTDSIEVGINLVKEM